MMRTCTEWIYMLMHWLFRGFPEMCRKTTNHFDMIYVDLIESGKAAGSSRRADSVYRPPGSHAREGGSRRIISKSLMCTALPDRIADVLDGGEVTARHFAPGLNAPGGGSPVSWPELHRPARPRSPVTGIDP